MKITFLGTGAIGYPLAFCHCKNCVEARTRGGKSIRKRASLLIDDEMLIDLGPDVQTSMYLYGKDMSKVKYLLQTHIHTDHYDAGLLCTRIPYLTNKDISKLHVVSHPSCLKIMSDRVKKYEDVDLMSIEGKGKTNIETHSIKNGEQLKLGGYTITGVDCNHDKFHGSILYIISKNGKNVMYATDAKPFTDKAIETLKRFKLDVLILDHNFGNITFSGNHLNEKLFIAELQILRKNNIIDDNTIIYGTHISHDGNPYHEEAEERAMKNGYHIAFDGLEFNI